MPNKKTTSGSNYFLLDDEEGHKGDEIFDSM